MGLLTQVPDFMSSQHLLDTYYLLHKLRLDYYIIEKTYVHCTKIIFMFYELLCIIYI